MASRSASQQRRRFPQDAEKNRCRMSAFLASAIKPDRQKTAPNLPGCNAPSSRPYDIPSLLPKKRTWLVFPKAAAAHNEIRPSICSLIATISKSTKRTATLVTIGG